MNPQAMWSSFVAAHPLYSSVISMAIGGFALPRAVSWFENSGVQKLTDWADRRQKAALARAGLSQEQIREIRLHEVKEMRAAADELEKDINAESQAAANAPSEQPAQQQS